MDKNAAGRKMVLVIEDNVTQALRAQALLEQEELKDAFACAVLLETMRQMGLITSKSPSLEMRLHLRPQ